MKLLDQTQNKPGRVTESKVARIINAKTAHVYQKRKDVSVKRHKSTSKVTDLTLGFRDLKIFAENWPTESSPFILGRRLALQHVSRKIRLLEKNLVIFAKS